MGWSSPTHSMPVDGENKRGPLLVPQKKNLLFVIVLYCQFVVVFMGRAEPNVHRTCSPTQLYINRIKPCLNCWCFSTWGSGWDFGSDYFLLFKYFNVKCFKTLFFMLISFVVFTTQRAGFPMACFKFPYTKIH